MCLVDRRPRDAAARLGGTDSTDSRTTRTPTTGTRSRSSRAPTARDSELTRARGRASSEVTARPGDQHCDALLRLGGAHITREQAPRPERLTALWDRRRARGSTPPARDGPERARPMGLRPTGLRPGLQLAPRSHPRSTPLADRSLSPSVGKVDTPSDIHRSAARGSRVCSRTAAHASPGKQRCCQSARAASLSKLPSRPPPGVPPLVETPSIFGLLSWSSFAGCALLQRVVLALCFLFQRSKHSAVVFFYLTGLAFFSQPRCPSQYRLSYHPRRRPDFVYFCILGRITKNFMFPRPVSGGAPAYSW